MIDNVAINTNTNILEIGCGDGFLTEKILQTSCNSLTCIEIDPRWASTVNKKFTTEKLEIINQDFLSFDLKKKFNQEKQSLILLANLPYQITFPILFKILEHKNLFKHGVFMVQEEVAQKLIATKGKGYNHVTMQLAYNFDFKLLDRIPPDDFYPAPKVFSRTVYFQPNQTIPIPNENQFWQFVSSCFQYPRQTINNNLKKSKFHEVIKQLELTFLQKRAQQITLENFLQIWKTIEIKQN